jgi:hypothetical protein
MAKSKTTWQAGQSGNPKGRPPKSRALTEVLERSGKAKVQRPDGKTTTMHRMAAAKIWEGLVFGEIQFEGTGRKLQVESVAELVALAKFLYGQIDGPPRQDIDLSSAGKPITGLFTADQLAAINQQADDELADFEGQLFGGNGSHG